MLRDADADLDGEVEPFPVILVGSAYWRWLDDALVGGEYIDAQDRALFHIVDPTAEVLALVAVVVAVGALADGGASVGIGIGPRVIEAASMCNCAPTVAVAHTTRRTLVVPLGAVAGPTESRRYVGASPLSTLGVADSTVPLGW